MATAMIPRAQAFQRPFGEPPGLHKNRYEGACQQPAITQPSNPSPVGLGVQLANAQNNSNNATGILPAVTSEQMQRLAANGTSFDKIATLNPFFVLEI